MDCKKLPQLGYDIQLFGGLAQDPAGWRPRIFPVSKDSQMR
jgi:hypothetical protein